MTERKRKRAREKRARERECADLDVCATTLLIALVGELRLLLIKALFNAVTGGRTGTPPFATPVSSWH